MSIKKTLPIKETENPEGKKQFKRTRIIIQEVENGYHIEVWWNFNDGVLCEDSSNNIRRFIAATEQEALNDIASLVPDLVEDDEDEECD